MKFDLHLKTSNLLEGLKGVEIYESAHNPYGVSAVNVADSSVIAFHNREQRRMEEEPAEIDIDAPPTKIPFLDSSVDFVLSSHIFQYIPDPIAALKEWDRILRPGGYLVFMLPRNDALESDKKRVLTTINDWIKVRGAKFVIGKRHWVFTSESFQSIIKALSLELHFEWSLVDVEDPDLKAGNGFWVAYKKKGELTVRPSLKNKITIIIPTLDEEKGLETGKMALEKAGCDASLIVVAGEPRGFTATVNEGMQQVTDDDICILNDDIEKFQQDWLLKLSTAMYSNLKYGIVGPGGRSGTEPAKKGTPYMTGVQICDQLSYWCVLIRREVINQIGILDSRFIHYCSDNEYNNRAKKAGWKLVWVKSVYLRHKYHGSGLKSDWQARDKETFKKI